MENNGSAFFPKTARFVWTFAMLAGIGACSQGAGVGTASTGQSDLRIKLVEPAKFNGWEILTRVQVLGCDDGTYVDLRGAQTAGPIKCANRRVEFLNVDPRGFLPSGSPVFGELGIVAVQESDAGAEVSQAYTLKMDICNTPAPIGPAISGGGIRRGDKGDYYICAAHEFLQIHSLPTVARTLPNNVAIQTIAGNYFIMRDLDFKNLQPHPIGRLCGFAANCAWNPQYGISVNSNSSTDSGRVAFVGRIVGNGRVLSNYTLRENLAGLAMFSYALHPAEISGLSLRSLSVDTHSVAAVVAFTAGLVSRCDGCKIRDIKFLAPNGNQPRSKVAGNDYSSVVAAYVLGSGAANYHPDSVKEDSLIENVELDGVDLTGSSYSGGLIGANLGNVLIQNNRIKDIRFSMSRRVPQPYNGGMYLSGIENGLAIGKIGPGARVLRNVVVGEMKYVENEILPTYIDTTYPPGLERTFILVENPARAGGLVGGMDNFSLSASYPSNIELRHNTVRVKLNLPNHVSVGGIIGSRSHALIEDFYVEIDAVAKSRIGGAVGLSASTRTGLTAGISAVDVRSTEISRGIVRGACLNNSCIDPAAGPGLVSESRAGTLIGEIYSFDYEPLGIVVQHLIADIRIRFNVPAGSTPSRERSGALIGYVLETSTGGGMGTVYASPTAENSVFQNANYLQRSYQATLMSGDDLPLKCIGNLPNNLATGVAGCQDQSDPVPFFGVNSLLGQKLMASGNWSLRAGTYPILK